MNKRDVMYYQENLISHAFKEPLVKNHLGGDYGEFDVTGKYARTVDFISNGRFSNSAYCKALVAKFSELSNSQIPLFLDYQLSLLRDKKRWLFDLEKLIELNVETLDKIRPGLSKLLSINVSERLLVPTTEQIPENKLSWKGSDVDLLELIVALTQSETIVNKTGKVVRTEVVKVFEEIFGIKIKDPDKKIGAAITRKKDNAPFLRSLLQAYENYARKEGNK